MSNFNEPYSFFPLNRYGLLPLPIIAGKRAGQTHLGFKQDFFHIGLIPSGQ